MKNLQPGTFVIIHHGHGEALARLKYEHPPTGWFGSKWSRTTARWSKYGIPCRVVRRATSADLEYYKPAGRNP